VDKSYVNAKRGDAFTCRSGEFHAGEGFDFWGGTAANSGAYSQKFTADCWSNNFRNVPIDVSWSQKNVHLTTELKPSALMNKSALADTIGA
tara:strand:- start:86 stop:358 length:273 start_codon:yes stop_codon:yes gene_type:complete